MSILVVGAGATGGYFGGRLAQAGRDVTFLVRERRAAALRERGLRITGPSGTEVIEPRLVTAVPDGTGTSAGASGAVDVVLVTVKADGLDAVIPEIRAAVGPGTAIVPVLNGLRHLQVLNSAFGQSRVLGGVAVVSTQLDDNGDVRQLNDMASLTIGAQDGQRTQTVDRASDLLSGAGFPVSVSDDIVAAMWQKWAFIASAGALNCLLGGSVGEIVAVDGGDQTARAIIDEARAVAAAAGYPLADAAVTYMLGMLTAPGSSFTSSLFRDLRQGKPVEAETILGDLVAEGRKAGQPAPLLDAATVALRVHNAAVHRA